VVVWSKQHPPEIRHLNRSLLRAVGVWMFAAKASYLELACQWNQLAHQLEMAVQC
jgi:hypothetical protein